MNPYESINLPNVINAAGKMTYLGSSAVSEQVADHMAAAAKSYVDMADLKQRVGELVAEMTGAEAACVTSCAAAGIVIAVASCLTGTNLDHIESLPEIKGHKKDIILQKGHVVHFGANMTQMVRMTGASVKEIGTVNGVKDYHLENAITEETAAILYVISHHAISNEMLPLQDVVTIARKHEVPVIVDAAAEMDLKKYTALGADLVTYSGHKAIGGPTSGIVIGNADLIEGCQLQEKGIARAMKIGKENIMGLYHAVKEYVEISQVQVEKEYLTLMEELTNQLSELPDIQTRIKWDATRPIPRLQVIVTKDAGLTAKQLVEKLENNRPSIRTRNHLTDEGIIQFDPREIKRTELSLIRDAFMNIFSEKSVDKR